MVENLRATEYNKTTSSNYHENRRQSEYQCENRAHEKV